MVQRFNLRNQTITTSCASDVERPSVCLVTVVRTLWQPRCSEREASAGLYPLAVCWIRQYHFESLCIGRDLMMVE